MNKRTIYIAAVGVLCTAAICVAVPLVLPKNAVSVVSGNSSEPSSLSSGSEGVEISPGSQPQTAQEESRATVSSKPVASSAPPAVGTKPEPAPADSSSQAGVPSAPSSSSNSKPKVVFPLNINTATQEELAQVPGLSNELARLIVVYRTDPKTGELVPYGSVEELKLVKGMSLKVFGEVKGYLGV